MSKAQNLELFEAAPASTSGPKFKSAHAPMAEKLRPQSLEEFFGKEDLDPNLIKRLSKGGGRPPSLMLWGPPGSGKTTLARIISKNFDVDFVEVSAVQVGVKEVREIFERARRSPKQTLLFMDEIHRFNRAQQDAFLPHVENGTIALIGATTENPSFYINSALLSRAKLLKLPALSKSALAEIALKAFKESGLDFEKEALDLLVHFAAGDARRLINLIEAMALSGVQGKLSESYIEQFLKGSEGISYSREEEHYDTVSAFIKSMRGSDPDAALIWAFKMIEAGDDPLFIIRRMIIFASEDIGDADPQALQLAVATGLAFERLGLPEGKIPIAQCITYLACAPKSNRSYMAMHKAIAIVKDNPKLEVPLHIRNAPTKLMRNLGYAEGYKYPHHFPDAVVEGEKYLPEELAGIKIYQRK